MQIADMRATYGDDIIINAAATIADERFLRDGQPIASPGDARAYLTARLRPLEREVFMVVFLDNRHRPIACEAMFEGTIDAAPVYPREVAKRVLNLNAAAVVLAHNHPSGVADPSESDKRITWRTRDALATLDVRVLDHIVVGDAGTYSFAENHLI